MRVRRKKGINKSSFLDTLLSFQLEKNSPNDLAVGKCHLNKIRVKKNFGHWMKFFQIHIEKLFYYFLYLETRRLFCMNC